MKMSQTLKTKYINVKTWFSCGFSSVEIDQKFKTHVLTLRQFYIFSRSLCCTYSSRRFRRALTRCISFNYLLSSYYGHLQAPSSDPGHHLALKYLLIKTYRTSSNLMGLCRLFTEFLWPPFSPIIRFHVKVILHFH